MDQGGSRQVFGQTMRKKSSSSSRYQRQFGNSATVYRAATEQSEAERKAAMIAERRRKKQIASKEVEKAFGMETFGLIGAPIDNEMSGSRRGWLYNVLPTTVAVSNEGSAGNGAERSGLDLFFLSESGTENFKSTILYRPFFYVLPDLSGHSSQSEIVLELLTSSLLRMFEGSIYHVEVVYKIDLDEPNHLSPSNRKGRPMLKLTFDSVSELMDVRGQLRGTIEKNQHESKATKAVFSFDTASTSHEDILKDPLSILVDMREYDVPYTVRVCTDLDIRCGTWFTVELVPDEREVSGGVRLIDPDHESKADPVFLAFDIECTKAPLKFPSADVDEIFMISYMVRTPAGPQGYLIVSRSVVSSDVQDFEYTPKKNYPGPFHIFNEKDERGLLERFFEEYRKHAPQIVVTYNGDFFDFPFVEARAKHYGMDLFKETGVEMIGEEYRGRCSVHLDAFHWVQRDSYLPQGAQGLKAVTRYKLGYDPVEVDPEDMVRFAQERPVHMATYSVSDAVATYYLHEKYVHLFIFSLCTIIPMCPEDVLRKGSGTLCETLLMTQACNKSIICPNKQKDPLANFHDGHLLQSETYIGGKVECLETGVYRSDIEYDFDLKPSAFQELIGNVDRDLTFAIEVEGGKKREDYVNYDEIRSEIIKELEQLRDRPKRVEKPYIYHLDVGAMYPNIILSNRLQPSAIVDDATCASCDFNQSKNNCKRHMPWIWRGDYNPATKMEYERTKDQLSRETFEDGKAFHELPEEDQASLVAKRLKTYSGKAYGKSKVTEEKMRTDIVCMRENDFYVDTVRQFRDRRYEYKALKKTWSKKFSGATDVASKKEAEDRVLVYDSLQVAHKCILNSFYGYVMRKGARWRSMEMAGIVTKNGADIITQARVLVEQIGRPLELDTDGIWCILPKSFPDVYSFVSKNGSKLKLEYPCVMLNAACHNKFTNHQYQTLEDPVRGIYSTKSECSIFFEVDGPYRCMVIPASTEEGKLLKKRYAVFNFDGSLAELKGFELKRRGELELIKTFQSQVFERFLDGGTLEECYDSVADIANHWIDVIDTRGDSLDDDELVDLISENRSMSRQLEDYGDQKGTSQTTARRLGEFLGAEIIKDKGLNCKFIIAEQPYGAPVTERAIPTAIWKTEPAVMRTFLRKWLKSPGLDGDGLDIRNVLDWNYYHDRLGKTIQKIITIPAALQKVPNPVPRVEHPGWLDRKVIQMGEQFHQKSITDMFAVKPKVVGDIEDFNSSGGGPKRPIVHKRARRRISHQEAESVPEERVELSKDSFSSWLTQKKSTWRKTRKERRFQKTLAGGNSGTDKRQKTVSSMEGFVREAALSLAQREWQIIEVREITSYDALSPGSPSGSGEFVLWVMVGSDSLQKINISVPRTVFVSTRNEMTVDSEDILEFKKVERHLPQSKQASFLYEITMPEFAFKTRSWTKCLQPVHANVDANTAIETMYESGTPALSRVLSHLGSIVRLKASTQNGKKSYNMDDLAKVENPVEGDYLHASLSYKRMFLYVRINPKTSTGMVALFRIEGGSGSFKKVPSDDVDLTHPSQSGDTSFDIGASCNIWIVKPGAKSGQRNVSKRDCDGMFKQIVQTIRDTAGLDSEYGCISPDSAVDVATLRFVDSEELAYAKANEAITSLAKTSQGPSVILLNSNKPSLQLRRYMSSFSSSPVVDMPFPPGPAHNPHLSTLPALNWEAPAIQLSLEAYLFMQVVSFPKRASYSRYGKIPIGNLGSDENVAVFETGLSRLIEKSRALSWASPLPGKPDVGEDYMPSSEGGTFPIAEAGSSFYSQNDIWEDDDELVSPVIRQPGVYRSVCVDIEIQDLAIAALSDMTLAGAAPAHVTAGGQNPNSPTSVSMFDDGFNMAKVSGPLGDEMSTSISLPIVRALVNSWLRDAFNSKSLVADELLHHVYRLLSDPQTLLFDPALHRVVHALMKSTFMRVLGELQRLGCSIVYASFHRITVSTNKLELADAEEYIDFVIATARNQAEAGSVLSKVALRPKQFHTHFVFLDEFNFGTMQLERLSLDEIEQESGTFIMPEGGENSSTAVVPSVVTGWSLTNYLGSEIAQEYFRVLLGRFSKDVLKKQMELLTKEDSLALSLVNGDDENLLAYRRKMVSKHFANYLTRAVDEILKDGPDDAVVPPLLGDASRPLNPALEFIKNLIVVLELDPAVEKEVQMLKRSLLTQVDVPEYSQAAQWKNPCPKFILPDVFCSECQDSRDVNLCYIPPLDPESETFQHDWVCEDCGGQYDVATIETRLVQMVHLQLVRYQLQDLRCRKTKRVVTRTLASPDNLQLDTTAKEAHAKLRLLHSLAELHGLETLQETTSGILGCYQ